MDSAGSRSPLAAVVGATILVDAALARILLAADLERAYFLGKPIRHCGWYPDDHLRLV